MLLMEVILIKLKFGKTFSQGVTHTTGQSQTACIAGHVAAFLCTKRSKGALISMYDKKLFVHFHCVKNEEAKARKLRSLINARDRRR